MIRFFGAARLAITKLRTRRTRLLLTLFVTSILFSILIAASLIMTGFFESYEKFSNDGLSGRYIVAGTGGPTTWNETEGISRNSTFIARAELLQKQLDVQKVAKAKELGIQYVSSDDSKAILVNPDGTKMLNVASDIGRQILEEHRMTLRPSTKETFIKQFENLTPENSYSSVSQGYRPGSPQLNLITNGAESSDIKNQNPGQPLKGLKTITDGRWRLFDESMLEPFLLPGQSFTIGANNNIPVIAPYSSVEHALGLEPLPADASVRQKKQRLEFLRDKAGGISFLVCYRNSTSAAEYAKAVGQQVDRAANKDKAEYVEPELLLKLPTIPCTSPTVEKDTRTSQAKKEDEKWQKFNEIFEMKPAKSELISFRIVGLNRDYTEYSPNQSNFTPEQLLDSALALSAGGGWLSPLSLQVNSTAVKDIFFQSEGNIFGVNKEYYAEFKTAAEAKEALIRKTCSVSDLSVQEVSTPGKNSSIENNTPKCSRDGRQFFLQPFGGNSILIDQFKASAHTILIIAGGVAGLIAAIVLMGMLGRIIADSRKETAIFRALGATRLSIMKVYLMYTSFLIVGILALSIYLGFFIAYVVQVLYSPDFSIAAAVAFSVDDLSQQFNFIGIDLLALTIISCVIVGTSYLAALFPILRSMARNPLKDMRED